MINRSQRQALSLANKQARSFSNALSTSTASAATPVGEFQVQSLVDWSKQHTALQDQKARDEAGYLETLRRANTEHGAFSPMDASFSDSGHLKKIKNKINSIVA